MSSPLGSSQTSSESPIDFRIAIIGGGICGLVLAHGLNKYAHIDYNIYEAAESTSDIGAGISFGANGQNALKIINSSAFAAFEKHATRNKTSSSPDVWCKYVIGKGDGAGNEIFTLTADGGFRSFHRSNFLGELFEAVPSERVHFGKQCVRIEDNEGSPVIIHFSDGTTATADAIIGADGIHSTIRSQVVGENTGKPEYTGCAAYRGLIDMDLAIKTMGPNVQNSRIACGPGSAIVSYPIEDGKTLNIVLCDFEYGEWNHEDWIAPVVWDEIEKRFSGWEDNCQGLIKLMKADNHQAWSLWQVPSLPTFYKGRVALIGDSAHAMTPFAGQGVAQGLEDVLVLEKLLGTLTDNDKALDIERVLSAYDKVRRPRSQDIVKLSRETGQLFALQLAGIGDDREAIASHHLGNTQKLGHPNLQKQIHEAIGWSSASEADPARLCHLDLATGNVPKEDSDSE
ncbi:uncharacterized protein KY384_004565 [Bacidia gigantensis]|uniref:uncharacterized protein n=1 Tax=Bacidia gigantensis TaxID=2732470 RepID=UPI001D04FC14|nr:uncharacterized protein KY384_004565 [Bacidia gigantensis]KAG8531207.1 hypothetical protein KY384_004565 [Bacidia gigantensis]